LSDGGSIEAMTVGREGFTGLPIFNGVASTNWRMIGQVPGGAIRVRAADLLEFMEGSAELRLIFARYSQFFLEALSQSAACNRAHIVQERCARWLLMAHDRAGRDEFELTQKFISQMLGVRRPAVTVALGALVRAGFIGHRRARITVVDRPGLEAAACECYGAIRGSELHLVRQMAS
jgi:hypothetical protein